MKSRKILMIALMVLIVLTTVSFASSRVRTSANSNTNTNITNNTTANISTNNSNNANSAKSSNNEITNELSEDDLIPALEAKLKGKSQTNTNTSLDSNSNTSSRNPVFSGSIVKTPEISSPKTSKEINSDSKKEILDDVYVFLDENVEYINNYIKGNVYIYTDSNVLIEDTQIVGNVFLMSDSLELKNVTITGSSYCACTKDINIIASDLNSIYTISNVFNIDKDSTIETDLRAVGNDVCISGNIKRDLYVSGQSVEILDGTTINRKCDIRANKYIVPEKIEASKDTHITIIKNKMEKLTIDDLLPPILTEFVIILVISAIILGGSPKFMDVNLKLSRLDFIKAFFTGIIEIIILLAIAIAIIVWGFGIGYSIALISLIFTLIGLGKAIFVLAYSIRLIRKARRKTRRKAIVAEVFVALAVQALSLLPLLGYRGYIISTAIDLILGIVGFGTLVRVVLTPKIKENSNVEIESPKTQEMVATAPVQTSNAAISSIQTENGRIILEAKEVKIENVGKIEIIESKEKLKEKITVANEELKIEEEPKEENTNNEMAPENEKNNNEENDSNNE